MARMKFLCDAERCIECNGCVTACKNENEVPWGVNRRRVITLGDGEQGEKSVSVACMHCSDAPCAAVCPVDCFYTTDDGVVLHDKDQCIGCGYCFYACPFGAPQYPQKTAFGVRGKMDKCTFCAGGPEDDNSAQEMEKYGSNRLAEVNCLCALKCVPPKRCLVEMGTSLQISIESVSCVVAGVHKPGAGIKPTVEWINPEVHDCTGRKRNAYNKAELYCTGPISSFLVSLFGCAG